jgi:hypothetical protein
VDDAVRSLAEHHLGVPLLAGAFFRVRWGGPFYGAPLFAVFSFIAWRVQRRRAKLPASAYFAVTKEHVTVLEYRFGPPRIVREVMRWQAHEGRATVAGENRYSVDIFIGGRTIELEALSYNEESAAVVDALVSR